MGHELPALSGRPLVRTDDLDELVSRVTDLMSTHTVVSASAGGFSAEVFGFHLPGVSLLEMEYGMAVRLSADPLPGYVAVSLPLVGSMTAQHQGRRFEAVAGRSAVVGTPASELVMDWDAALRLQVLRIDLEALQFSPAGWSPPNPRSPMCSSTLSWTPRRPWRCWGRPG